MPAIQTPKELPDLLLKLVDEQLDRAEMLRLSEILRNSPASEEFYDDFITVHSLLTWQYSPPLASVSPPLLPAIQPPPSSAYGFPAAFQGVLHGTIGYFSEGMPLAYSLATVITGLGLLIGSLIHVSAPEQIARQSIPRPSPLSPLPSVVGRVTGMVDCRWAEKGTVPFRAWGLSPFPSEGSGVRGQGHSLPSPACGRGAGGEGGPNRQSLVALGDKYALASGLMEITYDTGAKVILQGPVTYEVDSNGGYLSVGKLTGKLEKKAEGNERLASLSTIHYPLFTIRTPTAAVTDLGTEFGVETDGVETRSYVFQGEIEVTAAAAGGGKPQHVRLKNGQSLVVDRSGVAASRPTIESRRFVRVMPARLEPSFPAFADGEVVFRETFDTDSDTLAATYPNLTFYLDPVGTGDGRSHAAVRNGVLQLNRRAGSKVTETVLTTKSFSGRMLVSVDVGGDTDDPGAAYVALRLGELVFLFHPGSMAGNFRAESKGACIDDIGRVPISDDSPPAHNVYIGFFPEDNVLQHLSVYYDGEETYQVSLINGAAPHQAFRRTYKSDANCGAAFHVGVLCMKGGITGLFDNLRVIQLPGSDATPTSRNTQPTKVDRHRDSYKAGPLTENNK